MHAAWSCCRYGRKQCVLCGGCVWEREGRNIGTRRVSEDMDVKQVMWYTRVGGVKWLHHIVTHFVSGAELNIKYSQEEKEAKHGEGPVLWWGPVSPQCRLHSNWQKWSQFAFCSDLFFFSWKWTEKVTLNLTFTILILPTFISTPKAHTIWHLQISCDFCIILGWDSAHLCTGGISHTLWSGSNELNSARAQQYNEKYKLKAQCIFSGNKRCAPKG